MVTDFYATKLGMTQAWTTSGKRLAITRCQADDLPVITSTVVKAGANWRGGQPRPELTIIEVGLGRRKLANMKKPLQTKVSKSGFSFGVKHLKGIRLDQHKVDQDTALQPGSIITVDQVVQVGDVVQVQGVTKGRGFAGGIKRYGFSGGPKTHGQSDRERAVGSIGAGTFPGRVWKGKRMPGHYGQETTTVTNLVVVHVDPTSHELWLSGPVPGSIKAQLRIRKTNQTKQIELDKIASQLPVVSEKEAAELSSDQEADQDSDQQVDQESTQSSQDEYSTEDTTTEKSKS